MAAMTLAYAQYLIKRLNCIGRKVHQTKTTNYILLILKLMEFTCFVQRIYLKSWFLLVHTEELKPKQTNYEKIKNEFRI